MIWKKLECKNPEKDEFLLNFSWLQSFAWVFLNLYYNFWGIGNLENSDISGFKMQFLNFFNIFKAWLWKIENFEWLQTQIFSVFWPKNAEFSIFFSRKSRISRNFKLWQVRNCSDWNFVTWKRWKFIIKQTQSIFASKFAQIPNSTILNVYQISNLTYFRTDFARAYASDHVKETAAFGAS